MNEEYIKSIAMNSTAYLKGSDLYKEGKYRQLSKITKGKITTYHFLVNGSRVYFDLNGRYISNIKCESENTAINSEVVCCLLHICNNSLEKKLQAILNNSKL